MLIILISPQFLNEKIPGLPYECLGQFGHVHQPCFRMVVVFNGKVYQGEGNSKKTAKLDAAKNACDDWFKVRYLESQKACKTLFLLSQYKIC